MDLLAVRNNVHIAAATLQALLTYYADTVHYCTLLLLNTGVQPRLSDELSHLSPLATRLGSLLG
jgi:hypothetical protein